MKLLHISIDGRIHVNAQVFITWAYGKTPEQIARRIAVLKRRGFF
jgi:hypothetical protein